jgi:hypothetical protein
VNKAERITMRSLRSRPLTTPVKLLATALVLGAGTIGVAASAAHADGQAAGPIGAGPIGASTKQFAMFHCASPTCTAGSYGNNFSNDTQFIAQEEHRLLATCKIRTSGPTSYLGTVDGWTGTWRVISKDLAAPDDSWATDLPDC